MLDTGHSADGPIAPEPPDLDPETPERLLRLVGRAGGPAFLAGLVDVFSKEAAEHLRDIEEAIGVDDHPRLRRAAHTLKGAAGHMGLLALVAAADRVSEAARHERPVSPDVLPALEAALARGLGALRLALGPPPR